MKKALKILKILKKEGFYLETNWIDKKGIAIDKAKINEAIEDLESLQNRTCGNCKHYSTGKQPDGFKWHKCDYAFECKTCFNDYFERAEQ